MLGSVNAFGGLSAADILKLFGANSSSSSSNSMSASAGQSASTGVFASDVNDPTKAIKAILAQAKIDQAGTQSPAGGSAGDAAAEAGYAAQLGGSSTVLRAIAAAVASSSEVVETEQAWMDTSGGGLAISVNAAAGEAAGQVNGASYQTGVSAASVSVTSTADATSDLGANPQAEQVDMFQATVAVGDHSVAVGFAVKGLGKVELDPSVAGFSVGQGTLAGFFQLGVSVDGEHVALGFNVGGLDAVQAQQLGAAFEQATSAPDQSGIAGDAAQQYTENFGSGFSATFDVIIGYQTECPA